MRLKRQAYLKQLQRAGDLGHVFALRPTLFRRITHIAAAASFAAQQIALFEEPECLTHRTARDRIVFRQLALGGQPLAVLKGAAQYLLSQAGRQFCRGAAALGFLRVSCDVNQLVGPK